MKLMRKYYLFKNLKSYKKIFKSLKNKTSKKFIKININKNSKKKWMKWKNNCF